MTMRFGLRRFPVVTAVVFAVTGLSNALQFLVPGMLARLERAPAGLHGDWWRTGTALFVQDGGVAGTLSNLAFLVVAGAVAEQVTSRPRWLLGYFGTALAGEFTGYAWQPYGGGNSIAICGLAGVVAVALWRGDVRLPPYAPVVLLIWCGALAADLWYPLVTIGVAASVLANVAADRGVPVARWAVAGALLTGAAMTVAENIHGAALLTGIAIAALLAGGRSGTVRGPAACQGPGEQPAYDQDGRGTGGPPVAGVAGQVQEPGGGEQVEQHGQGKGGAPADHQDHRRGEYGERDHQGAHQVDQSVHGHGGDPASGTAGRSATCRRSSAISRART
ncbi:membrane associated rhomboid family serine protease [Actinoallomurus bryophytorum]|uniref:Membrane associated rhomboid family serine protease n=1 Tax=Actinoallomurus bryophytorum TaxID=1490222 RepID=A0A543CGB4_9ACTN|nr:rhomboid family intramembrane serine protease [Actinoallomurus bryophytorum]TQL96143.1 membrane associated rhomboid family serine protease [Actinoallomurus bryophytorum]